MAQPVPARSRKSAPVPQPRLVPLAACAVALLLAIGCGNNANQAAANTGSGSGSPSGTGGAGGSGSGTGSGGSSGSSSSANSAFVYVSTPSISGGPGNTITAYTAASDGALTQIAGSPYKTTGQAAAVAASGNLLFVAEGGNIVAYTIGSSGALTAGPTTNAQAHDIPSTDGFPASLFTDPGGATLYDLASAGYNLGNQYQAYSIQQNGGLTFLNMTTQGNPADFWLSFNTNDTFAYSSDCSGGTANFYAYSRASSGALTYFNPHASVPAPPADNPGGTSYCPEGAAVAGNNYVVIALQLGTSANSYQGTNQLAVYAIAADGSLSTTNTAATMPSLSVSGYANDYAFDPTGTWLAAGGSGGVQIFKLSGGVLTETGSLALSGGVSQLAWDKAGHLYTYGQDSGDLNVLTVTNGVPAQASGSPHTLPVSSYLAVQPAS